MYILFGHVTAAAIITSQEQEAHLLRQLRLFQRCSLPRPPWLLTLPSSTHTKLVPWPCPSPHSSQLCETGRPWSGPRTKQPLSLAAPNGI